MLRVRADPHLRSRPDSGVRPPLPATAFVVPLPASRDRPGDEALVRCAPSALRWPSSVLSRPSRPGRFLSAEFGHVRSRALARNLQTLPAAESRLPRDAGSSASLLRHLQIFGSRSWSWAAARGADDVLLRLLEPVTAATSIRVRRAESVKQSSDRRRSRGSCTRRFVRWPPGRCSRLIAAASRALILATRSVPPGGQAPRLISSATPDRRIRGEPRPHAGPRPCRDGVHRYDHTHRLCHLSLGRLRAGAARVSCDAAIALAGCCDRERDQFLDLDRKRPRPSPRAASTRSRRSPPGCLRAAGAPARGAPLSSDGR